MARIPMGNFGNAMPDVQRIQMPQNQSGQMIAGALQNISQVAGQKAQQKDQQQREAEVSAKRLELYNNQIAEQEAKVKLDDVLTTEMSEQVTLLKNDVSNGTTKAQDANATLKQWSENRYKQLEAEMPGHAQKDLKQYWDDSITKQAPGFLPLQLRADVQKGVVLADRYAGIATRYDRKKGREYLESNLAPLNLPEADVQSRLYKYESTRDLLDINSRISEAVKNQDTAALNGLISEMKNGGFGFADAKTLQQKEAQAQSRISAIETQIKAEENKRENEAEKYLNDFKSQVFTGRMLDDDYVGNVEKLLKGTSMESEFLFYKKETGRIQTFAHLNTTEQAKQISQKKANMKNSKTSDAVAENKLLSVYESIYQEKISISKNNPNQVVKEAGLKVNELSAVELKTNPSGFAAKAIENGTSQLALRDANIKLAPISSEDLPEAKKAFEELGVGSKLNFISQSIQQAKGVKGGDRIWKATLQQLGGADKTYYLAGLAKAKNKKINNEDLASALINGKYLVDKGGFILPTDLESTFRARYGNLSNYGAYADDLTQFKYAYAVIANRDGVRHAKKDDVSDVTAKNKAFELATGGVYVQETESWFGSFKTSGGGTFKSWNVPKPYGMSDDRFESYLEAGYANLSKLSGHTVSELKGFRLAPRIDRNSNLVMYDLLNEQGQPLLSSDGKQSQFIIFKGVTR